MMVEDEINDLLMALMVIMALGGTGEEEPDEFEGEDDEGKSAG